MKKYERIDAMKMSQDMKKFRDGFARLGVEYEVIDNDIIITQENCVMIITFNNIGKFVNIENGVVYAP